MSDRHSLWESRGAVYDAVSILEFGSATDEPLPDPQPGTIMVRVGNWSYLDLRTNEKILARGLMFPKRGKSQYDTDRLSPGIHRVRLLRPPGTIDFMREWRAFFRSSERLAPVALLATALVVHLWQTGEGALEKSYCYCDGNHFGHFPMLCCESYVQDMHSGNFSGRRWAWCAASEAL